MRSMRFLASLLLVLLITAGGTLAMAEGSVESALRHWSGERTLLLRSDLPDPLADPEIRNLLPFLLANKFEPALGDSEAPAPAAGLLLDLRIAGDSRILVLTRAADGVILAFETREAAVPEPPVAPQMKPAPAPAPAKQEAAADRPIPAARPIDLPGQPRRLAILGSDQDGIDLLLLYDRSLARFRFTGERLEKTAEWRPAGRLRALHLDAGDLDGDGRREAVAVWAEDIGDIDAGTDSRLHSLVFRLAGHEITPLGPELAGYLRILDGKVLLQKRGRHLPFGGEIVTVDLKSKDFSSGGSPVPWAGENLFQTTLDSDGSLAWMWHGDNGLALQKPGEEINAAAGWLIEDLGDFVGAEVFARKEKAEFHSGFEKEGRIRENKAVLPRRLFPAGERAAYTILRGRSTGLPVIGTTSGQDEVVRIGPARGGLAVEHPFPGASQFILDFGLVPTPEAAQSALLLLNEKPDGSGRAWLLQQSR